MNDKFELSPTFVPEMPQIPNKYIHLWSRHNRSPVPNSLWGEVTALAKREENTDRAKRGIYGQVPLESLLDLAKRVRTEKDPVARYRLMTEVSPTGKIWFDTLVGLSSAPTIEVLAEQIGRKHWDRGLDVGVGTGNLSVALKPYCNTLVSLDQTDFLLRIAKQRLSDRGDFVQADALALPFSKAAFDIVASTGLTPSLTKNQLKQFALQVHRILKPGANFFDAAILPEGENIHRHDRPSLANAKGILADLIVDAVSGKGRLTQSELVSDYRDYIFTIAEAGFRAKFTEDAPRAIAVLEYTKY